MNRALELPHVQKGERVGLREFRMLVAAAIVWESARGTRRDDWKCIRGRTIAAVGRASGVAQLSCRIGRSAFRLCSRISRRRRFMSRSISIVCRAEEAVTNWESGRFTLDDLAWALANCAMLLRFVGGDICGALFPHAICASGSSALSPSSIIRKLAAREPAEIVQIKSRRFRATLAAL